MPAKTTWENLSPKTQILLFYNGDPRVPPGWEPPRAWKKGPGPFLRPPTVIVPLTKELVELPEKELWVLLVSTWKKDGIAPETVTFSLPNGNRLPPVPVPEIATTEATVKRARRADSAKIPQKRSTPLGSITCEHCHKEVTEWSYKAYHGVKCWRAP